MNETGTAHGMYCVGAVPGAREERRIQEGKREKERSREREKEKQSVSEMHARRGAKTRYLTPVSFHSFPPPPRLCIVIVPPHSLTPPVQTHHVVIVSIDPSWCKGPNTTCSVT